MAPLWPRAASALRAWRLSGETRSFAGFLAFVMLVGALGGPLRGLLPVRVEAELGQPPAFSSLLQALVLGGGGVFALLGGVVADRLGRKRALTLGTLYMGPMAFLHLADSTTAMVAAAAAAGLIDGLYIVGGQAYLVASAPRGAVGLGSALYFLGSTLGVSLGSLAAGALVERAGFGALGLVGLVGAGTAALLATRLPGGQPAGSREPVAHRRPGGRLEISRDLLLVATVRFLPTCYWGAATLLMPLLLFRLSQSVVAVSLYSAVSLTSAAACQILTGRASDRLGRGVPVLVLTLLFPFAALGTALATRSYVTLFVAGVLVTCVAWSISVNFPPLVRELTPEGEHGRALGFLHTLWVSAMLLGTLAGGRLVDAEPALPFLIGAALNVPTAIAGVALWRRLDARRARA